MIKKYFHLSLRFPLKPTNEEPQEGKKCVLIKSEGVIFRTYVPHQHRVKNISEILSAAIIQRYHQATVQYDQAWAVHHVIGVNDPSKGVKQARLRHDRFFDQNIPRVQVTVDKVVVKYLQSNRMFSLSYCILNWQKKSNNALPIFSLSLEKIMSKKFSYRIQIRS